MGNKIAKQLEEEYILNLQKQTVLLEHELKLLKEREVEQKNRASGYGKQRVARESGG